MVFCSGLTHVVYRMCTCRCYECGCRCCDEGGCNARIDGGLTKYEYHRSDDDLPRNAGDAWKKRWLAFWSRIGEAIGEMGPNQESRSAFVVMLQVYAGADERAMLRGAAPIPRRAISYDVEPSKKTGSGSVYMSADAIPKSDIVAHLEKLFTTSPEHFSFYFPQLCNYVLRRLMNDDQTAKRTTRLEVVGEEGRKDEKGEGAGKVPRCSSAQIAEEALSL